ncbi:hypothetical protein [Bordetella genomosp. 9]|uniref:hypothetical protein n=1 Tax=Bordetella genomosp. 9 TaxID=1416803 RepID=UPI0012FC7AD3|nr:hypothetical protein [Bordetella genomosp. 9]
MPFDKPFRTAFHPGDLVYGLHEIRAHYFESHSSFSHAPFYRDEYNLPIIIDHFILPYEYGPGYREMLSDGQKQCRNHQLLKEFVQFLGAHPSGKYRYLFTGSPSDSRDSDSFSDASDSTEAEEAREDKMTFRKCKAGLAWEAARNGHIHFMLDAIDIDAVVNKIPPYGDSITASELRWVYRNRFKVEVQHCIQFWHKGEPVIPPWQTIDGKAVWERYSPNLVPGRPSLSALRFGR